MNNQKTYVESSSLSSTEATISRVTLSLVVMPINFPKSARTPP